MPKRENLPFGFYLKDPFQEKLYKAIRSIPHGLRNPFFINLCRMVFSGMSQAEMQEVCEGLAFGSPETMNRLATNATNHSDTANLLVEELEGKPAQMPKPSLEKKQMPQSPPSFGNLFVE